jgi:hypothetical protein
VLLAIYVQERYTLPADQTRPLRRIQHDYLSCWDRVVASLRPDLSAAEVALNVRSVVEMIHSIVFYNHPIEPERVALLLYDLAVRALAPCGAGGAAAGTPLPISPADCQAGVADRARRRRSSDAYIASPEVTRGT